MDEAELERRALAIMERPYHKVICGDATDEYVAKVLEFPGCLTDGNTEEEAVANLREAMLVWLMTVIDHDDPIPEPIGDQCVSRQITIPATLYDELLSRARMEGLSPDAAAAHLLSGALAVPQR